MPGHEQDVTITTTNSDARTDSNIANGQFTDVPLLDPPIENDFAPLNRLSGRSTTQAIQSLDLLSGFSSQLIGASGESDPWLLRHGKFDDRGYMLFHQAHFRNAGGVPLEEKIPVHFLVTADEVYESAKDTTSYGKIDRREELNTLVPLEHGQRLVSLYNALLVCNC